MRLRPVLAALLAGVVLVAPLAHAAPPEMTPYVEGPDREPGVAPTATVTVLDKASFHFREKDVVLYRTVRARLPKAPAGGWDRILLEITDVPSDDEPWDRVFSVAVGKVELIRGTTPRAAMTLRKDVTEYAAALGSTRPVEFTTHDGTYVGSHDVTLRLEFYDGVEQLHPPASALVGSFTTVGIEPEHEDASRHSAVARTRFPAKPPTSARVELTTSGHLQGGEFWYLPDRGSTTPPVFHLLVEGTEVATAHAMPYLYALVGFEGQNTTAHPAMWWTGQRMLDIAGVHTGVGEIPPYRATLPADVLPLLTGARTVELTVDGLGLWISSVTFLLD